MKEKNNNTTLHGLSYLQYALSIMLLLGYSFLIFCFVAHDGLSSFASDSVNYMLMATNLSPWQAASAPIQAAWFSQDYPPFFPFLLAITGAAHNYIAAHFMVVLFLLFSFPLIYFCARRYFASPWHAIAITCLFAICPSVWINVHGILSESLYLFLSLVIVIIIHRVNFSTKVTTLLSLGLLLGLLILTRTIGFTMLAAFILIGMNHYYKGLIGLKNILIPTTATIFIVICSQSLLKPGIPTQYAHVFGQLFNASSISDINYIGYFWDQQLMSLIDAWKRAWLYYWIDDIIIPQLFVILVGILAITGLFLRTAQFEIDAVYVSLYLLVILFWPHPGQASRFLFPVLPFLVIYIFYAIYFIANRINIFSPSKPLTIIIVIALAIAGPSLAYTWHRYHAGSYLNYHHITEFYRNPNLIEAMQEAEIQLTLFSDIERIRLSTSPNDKILFFEPSYIYLLADRHTEKLSSYDIGNEFYNVAVRSKADYIYITRLVPKRTQKGVNGLEILYRFDGWTNLVWHSVTTDSGRPISFFLTVKNR